MIYRQRFSWHYTYLIYKCPDGSVWPSDSGPSWWEILKDWTPDTKTIIDWINHHTQVWYVCISTAFLTNVCRKSIKLLPIILSICILQRHLLNQIRQYWRGRIKNCLQICCMQFAVRFCSLRIVVLGTKNLG